MKSYSHWLNWACCRSSLVLLILHAAAATSWGQKPPPPVPPNPLAPTMAQPFPPGVQRGTSLELTLTGTNLADPTGLWTSFPAKVTIPTDANNGKDATKLRVRLDVPKDAPVGIHGLRLATARGLSNLRLFCVDDLPQVLEIDTNRSKTTPQAVTAPCVVVGRADAEVFDYYKITVQAGQRTTFEVIGRRLGSPIDPQITLIDPRTGRDLPGGFSSDAPGLQTDARLIYTFKEAGDVLIEVRDTLYRGGADYCYRLRIGDFPCATTTVPMAAKRGSKITAQFAGPLVDGVSPVEIQVPTDPAADTVWVTPRGSNGQVGLPAALAVTDVEEIVEKEPNDQREQATRVPIPGGVTGRFEKAGEVDHLICAGKKGQRLIIEAQTLEWNSPTEVYMILTDAAGKELARSNAAQAPRLDYTPPADGDLILAVEHLLGASGPAETYHIAISPYEPGFDLALGIDRFDVPQGAVTPVNVLVTRRDYTGPIELTLMGVPGLTGQASIAANQAAGPLVINAISDAPLGPYTARIRGQATISGKPVVAYTNVRTVLIPALAGLPFPPRDMLSQIGLAVTEKPPFLLTARFDPPEGLRGGTATMTVTATRQPGFADEIALTLTGLPPNVTQAAKMLSIAKDQTETKVVLNVAANAGLGEFILGLSGKAKYQNRDFTVTALPTRLVVALPFDLKVEPALLKLAAGDKAKLKVTAVRKGGYQGPIGLEVKNLPANVSAAAKLTIAMGQDSAEVEIAAAANAAVGDKADVNIQGTATAAANQQNASPNFTVSVGNK